MAATFSDIPYPAADDDAANKKYVDDQTGGGGGGGSGGFRGVNHQTGTSYAVDLTADNEKLITLNNPAAVSVTLPSVGAADHYDVAPDSYQFDALLCLDPVNGISGIGQSFTAAVSGNITKAKFFIKRIGSPTGNAVAKLYAHTGTYGTSSIPGTLLATSDNLDVTTVSTSGALTDLIFSTAHALVSGTNYVITLEYSGPDTSNCLAVAYTNVMGHSGNEIELFGGSWHVPGTRAPIGSLTTFVTASAATDLVTVPIPHGLVAGDWVMLYDTTDPFGSHIPSPLYNATSYFVAASGLTTTAFKIATTPGGAAQDLFSDAGVNAVVAFSLTLSNKELIFYVYTDAVATNNKWLAYFENLGAGLVTISALDTTIDGDLSIYLTQDTGVIIACDGSAYYTCRGEGLGTEDRLITVKVAGADFTTSSTTLVNITGLSFAAIANTLYELDIRLKCHNSTTNGLAIALNYSTSGATVTWAGTATSNGVAIPGLIGSTTLNSHGGTFGTISTKDSIVSAQAYLTTGANAGNITVQIMEPISGSATVYKGSRMTIREL